MIEFDEPFGFSVVEAMASGTPVIAHPRGSMPELITHGANGYLVSSVEEAVGSVREAAGVDPARVRAAVEERFDVNRMVDAYLAIYHQVLALEHDRAHF